MNLLQVVKDNFERYAGSVTVDRAICDVRDMLKPSTRAILYSHEHFTKSKGFTKSARVVGDALAEVYNHGDTSCYDTYMRLAKPFTQQVPLEECQGNAGTVIINGDHAAMRYTELQLSAAAKQMFEGISKHAIAEWKTAFDGETKHPAVLPSIGYYNIVNGATGIGVGLATSVPQFNLKEVNDKIEELILNPQLSEKDAIVIPDFCTGGILMNKSEVVAALAAGNGKSCRLQAKMEYKPSTHSFLVTELPYGVYTSTITTQLRKKIEEDANYGVLRVVDESGKVVRYEIFLSKLVDADLMRARLMKDTDLEAHYPINLWALKDGRYPTLYTFKGMLQAYIDHIRQCQRNILDFEVEQLEQRNHILSALQKAIASIDETIALIRGSKDQTEAAAKLKSRFLIDDAQAAAILGIKLARLANMEAIKIDTELRENMQSIESKKQILAIPSKLDAVLIAALRKTAQTYNAPRKTAVLDMSSAELEASSVWLLATPDGRMKQLSKGTKNAQEVPANSKVYFFQADGTVKTLRAKDVPQTLTAPFYVTPLLLQEYDYVLTKTKKGYVKKTRAKEYISMRNGSKLMNLKAGDAVVSYLLIHEDDENGKRLPISSRNTYGSKI